MRNPLLTVLSLLFVAASCMRPSVEDSFVKSEASVEGVYSFPLDMTDSLAVYDIFVYTRSENKAGEIFPIAVDWISPSGNNSLQERIWMDSGGKKGSKVLYRENVKPSEYGEWTLKMRPNALNGICGLGVISRRKDGSR